MPTVDEVVRLLDEFAPPALAEEWDNVGLLVGDRGRAVCRLMTCLTLTPATVAEAIEHKADLIVVHHPLPFRPVSQITTDTTVGRLLWDLIGARIGRLQPAHGVRLGPRRDQPTAGRRAGAHARRAADAQPKAAVPSTGAGRCGAPDMPLTLADMADRVKEFLSLEHVRLVGQTDQAVHRVAVACGSGGSFLAEAQAQGCDCLVTGEANFHTCLEAEAIGVGLILAGHFASERFALERLADSLDAQFPDVQIWASEREARPAATVLGPYRPVGFAWLTAHSGSPRIECWRHGGRMLARTKPRDVVGQLVCKTHPHSLGRALPLCQTLAFSLRYPVFNEANHVMPVLDAVVRHAADVLVVDDGSTDGTAELLDARGDVYCIRHPQNLGYGAALKTAFDYAVSARYDILVTIDCDGQHEPQRIQELVAACRDVDIVSGSRYLGQQVGRGDAPAERRQINHQITREINERWACR